MKRYSLAILLAIASIFCATGAFSQSLESQFAALPSVRKVEVLDKGQFDAKYLLWFEQPVSYKDAENEEISTLIKEEIRNVIEECPLTIDSVKHIYITLKNLMSDIPSLSRLIQLKKTLKPVPGFGKN